MRKSIGTSKGHSWIFYSQWIKYIVKGDITLRKEVVDYKIESQPWRFVDTPTSYDPGHNWEKTSKKNRVK